MRDYVKESMDLLSKLGTAKYHNYNFHGLEINYACFEFISDRKLAESLEDDINKHCTPESGARATVSLLGYNEYGNGKIRYMLEIYPYCIMPFSEWGKVTEDFLKGLPHLIRNFILKH